MMTSPQTASGLYVHVPFCAKKCEYCAFYSESSNGELVQRYVDAVCREIRNEMFGVRPETIFFGGGTPSILNLRQWEQILTTLSGIGALEASEWTVECNPSTVSLDKARLLREGGVNRISMGVQSMDEALLDRLGRVHSREAVFRSYDVLRRAGFENVNLDLMFAIPGQTLDVWDKTISEALAMAPEHLSCYEVIYEEDTPLYEQMQAGLFDVDESLACDMYRRLLDRVEAAGFVQYEIANFARGKGPDGRSAAPEIPSLACRHNVNYWRGGGYHGLGPSAAGYVNGSRTQRIANTQVYCQRIEQGQSTLDLSETLDPLCRAGEIAAFGLRMPVGWGFDEFRRVTGFDLRSHWGEAMNDLEGRRHAVVEPLRFRLTPLGLRFADAAAELFLR